MKKIYIIGGTMGVGKTTVCQSLKKRLPNAVFLDGDWCWDADPFQVNEETKEMVIDNIRYIMNNFIHCSSYENIIFGWVMHEQNIIKDILDRLDLSDCEVHTISLLCEETELRKRICKDVKAGIRTMEVLERSAARIPLYKKLKTQKIDTTGKSVETVVDEILK